MQHARGWRLSRTRAVALIPSQITDPLRRRIIRNFALAGAVGLFALSCGRDKPTEETQPSIPRPTFVTSTVAGVCMGDDAVLNPGLVDGFGTDPFAFNCTANDVVIANARPATGAAIECTQGQVVSTNIVADVTEGSVSGRTDIGIWIADGGGTSAESGSCLHFFLPPGNNPPISDLDGDQCGDLENKAVVVGFQLSALSFVCDDPDHDGFVSIPACVSWTQPGGDRVCSTGSERAGTLPANKSKCNCEPFLVPITILGTIELKKVWVGTGGQTTLTIGSTAGGSDVASTTTGAAGGAPLSTGQKAVAAGNYFANETGGLTDYTASALVCFDDANNNGTNDGEAAVTVGTNNAVPVTSGQHVICTFTNTRTTGTIELKKVWVGTGGQTTLTIGSTVGGSEVASQLTGAAGAAPLTTTQKVVETGTFYANETGGLTDYTASPLVCFNDVNNNGTNDGEAPVSVGANNAVAVTTGQHVICTFTNTRNTGTIELKKVWVGTGGQTRLNIGSTIGGSDIASQLTGAAGAAPLTTTQKVVETGTFYANETGGLTDYTASAPVCFNDANDDGTNDGTAAGEDPVPVGANNAMAVTTGQHVICTFTNTRSTGTIELKKVWVGTGGQTTLTIGSTVGGSEVATQLTGAAGAAPLSTGPKIVETGTFYANESGGLTDYVASALACFNDADDDGTNDGTAAGEDPVPVGGSNAVAVATGQHVICTFTNSQLARLIIEKIVQGGGTQSFDFTRNPGGVTFSLTDGQSNNSGFSLLPMTYRVCELSLAVAWSATATVDDGSGPVAATLINPDAPADLGNRCVDVVLAFGDDKTVVFTNTPPPGGDARTIGYWKNWSSCTGGKQYDHALANGLQDKTLDHFLPSDPNVFPLGDIASLNCQQAVNILDKRTLDGTKKASDAAYGLAAQLLAAKLNYAAGAGQCAAATTAIADAQALLANSPPTGIDFTGTGDYLGPKSTNLLRGTALGLAATLDSYNNNTLCP